MAKEHTIHSTLLDVELHLLECQAQECTIKMSRMPRLNLRLNLRLKQHLIKVLVNHLVKALIKPLVNVLVVALQINKGLHSVKCVVSH